MPLRQPAMPRHHAVGEEAMKALDDNGVERLA
jgi:hypothetical protein